MADNLLPRKLNVGCGQDKRPGYLNIDVDTACDPDILIVDNDLSMLPRAYFGEVLAHDVLEHIPHASTMWALLDWAFHLADGGELVLQTSYVFGVIDRMRATRTFENDYNWSKCLFGNQAHPGDFHHYGFTETTLRVFLQAAGFEVSHFALHDGWLIACRARKVRDWSALARADTSEGDFINAAFRTYFHRDVDEQGTAYFSDLIEKKSRLTALKAIVAAPEHLYKVGAALEAPTLP